LGELWPDQRQDGLDESQEAPAMGTTSKKSATHKRRKYETRRRRSSGVNRYCIRVSPFIIAASMNEMITN